MYWERCSVTIVEQDSEGNQTKKFLEECDGQGTVPCGTELYLAGSGSVKET